MFYSMHILFIHIQLIQSHWIIHGRLKKETITIKIERKRRKEKDAEKCEEEKTKKTKEIEEKKKSNFLILFASDNSIKTN